MSEWVDATLQAMTIEEKIGMLAGHDLWRTTAIDRLGVPALKVTDGPNGVRGEDDNHGPTATSFPVGVAMGATFDPALIQQVAAALAEETRSAQASVLLGPTVNVPRVPIAGRNFECFSEDPVLSGTIAGAYIRGVQSKGVGACLKHFVCNDQEHQRYSIDVQVDARTLREIYLEPFRIAIEHGRPWAVMSAYNTVNGVTASESPLLEDVLRQDFGFDGAVISDWYGTYSPGVVASALDLEMPGPSRWMAAEHWHDALGAGTVSTETLDDKVRRLLTLIERTGAAAVHTGAPETMTESPSGRELARRAAVQSMVLLRNDGILPLADSGRIALLGAAAAATPHQGGGSSAVKPHRSVSVLEGLTQAVGARVTWSLGCLIDNGVPALDPQAMTYDDGAPGFLVQYFTGTALTGDPVRVAATRSSHFGFFGVGNRWVDYDDFSLRMSGAYRATASGVHRFGVEAIGRLRVWVDQTLVVDAWHSDRESDPEAEQVAHHEWDAELVEGQPVTVVLEYASIPGVVWRSVELGCRPPRPQDPVADAVAVAQDADIAVVVVGLGGQWESEGFDRPDMTLPGEQNRLVTEVAAVQPNTVVLVAAGSPIEMPWIDDVAAVVYLWYGGQEIGHAVADVLLGHEDPGGRLPVTFPVIATQHPGMFNYPGEAGVVRYGEGVYVGYRGFDQLGLRPLFEFGHGLSYTRFEARDVRAARRDGTWTVSLTVSNAGDRPGSETVLVYALGIGGVHRRLVGYAKVALDPGGERQLHLDVDPSRLRRWDPVAGRWAAEEPSAFAVAGTFGRILAPASAPDSVSRPLPSARVPVHPPAT